MTTRITKDRYKKPANTVQDNLTQEDIDILLEEYNEIDDIHQLKNGVHIRYYAIVKNKQNIEKKLFRMGGTIIKVDFEKKFLVLSNGRITWSVQINDKNIFYKKMTTEEIKEFYENELNTAETEQMQVKSNFKEMQKKYQELIIQNEKLVKKIEYQNKIISKAKSLIRQ